MHSKVGFRSLQVRHIDCISLFTVEKGRRSKHYVSTSPYRLYGNTTVSITWTYPLLPLRSVDVILDILPFVSVNIT